MPVRFKGRTVRPRWVARWRSFTGSPRMADHFGSNRHLALAYARNLAERERRMVVVELLDPSTPQEETPP